METFEIFKHCLASVLDSVPFFVFTILVVTDVVTGFMKGIVTKQPSSQKGFKGIMKHVCEVFSVMVIATVFSMLDMVEYGNMVIMAMFAVEGISLIGNLDAIGIPLPEWLVDFFGDIKDRKPKGDE